MPLARIPTVWNHAVDKDSRQLYMLEHVLFRRTGSTSLAMFRNSDFEAGHDRGRNGGQMR